MVGGRDRWIDAETEGERLAGRLLVPGSPATGEVPDGDSHWPAAADTTL